VNSNGREFRGTNLQAKVGLSFVFENPLHSKLWSKWVFDSSLATAGHDDDLVASGGQPSSTPYWMIGLSTSGSISLVGPWWREGNGCLSRGRETALQTFIVIRNLRRE